MKQYEYQLFSKYMEKKHPNFYFIAGSLVILWIISFLFNILAIWLMPDYYVKMFVTNFATAFILIFVMKLINGVYVSEFKDTLTK